MSTPSIKNPVVASRVSQAISEVLMKTGKFDTAENATSYLHDRLDRLGLLSEDAIGLIEGGFCKEGDARQVFCENGEPNLPVPWFRKLWYIMSGIKEVIAETATSTTDVGIAQLIESNKLLDQWADHRLVEAYGRDCAAGVIEQLAKRANGRAIVIFSNEQANEIDIELTTKMLRQARRRETPQTFKVGKRVFRLFKVGQFPNDVYEECPLHSGHLLVDGYCDKCELSYVDISTDARVFLRVALTLGKVDTDNTLIVRDLIEIAQAIDELRSTFPSVAIKYDDLAEEGRLPCLKKRADVDGIGYSPADPFRPGNKRF